jgi:hypothetical protein
VDCVRCSGRICWVSESQLSAPSRHWAVLAFVPRGRQKASIASPDIFGDRQPFRTRCVVAICLSREWGWLRFFGSLVAPLDREEQVERAPGLGLEEA